MAWKTRNEWENRAGIFFLALCFGPLIFLSASVSKFLVYFLPVHPVMTMLVAWSIVKRWTSPGRSAKILTWIIAMATIVVAGGLVGMTGIRGGSTVSVAAGSAVFLFAAAGCILSIRRNDLRWTAACVAVLFVLGWSLWFTGPIAEADVARRSIRRPMADALGRVGNRDIVLYYPTDGIRGAASFYRNRTAQEIKSPDVLVARLTKNHNEVVALVYWTDKDGLPPELDKTAQAAGANLQIEAHFDLTKRYLLLVSARPAGQ
jgi:4-amino-4-deoxy-L-arabinose transferase-like glycosyltransferase